MPDRGYKRESSPAPCSFRSVVSLRSVVFFARARKSEIYRFSREFWGDSRELEVRREIGSGLKDFLLEFVEILGGFFALNFHCLISWFSGKEDGR